MKAFELELGQEINNHKVPFILYPKLWEKFNWDKFNIDKNEFKEIKYLTEDGNVFDNAINDLPNDKGGIYIFFIKFNGVPNLVSYLVYIGRSLITNSTNLRKRCRSYFNTSKREGERPRIQKMFNFWGKYLYLKYLELDDNELIAKLEASLINTILPPFNDSIPDKNIRTAIKAFP